MEIFKPITDYENLYEISNTGIIKALDRFITDKKGKTKFYPGKILKFDTSKNNVTEYKRVTLSKNGKTSRVFVHRLVAQEFIPNPHNKPFVNHIDNNGSNNHVNNLEWCTHSENMQHSQKQGRQFSNQSKAGKIAGTNLRAKTLEIIENDIGSTYGLFTILSYALQKQKHQVWCSCSRCGNKFTIDYNRLISKTFIGCKKCKNVKSENLHTRKTNLKI